MLFCRRGTILRPPRIYHVAFAVAALVLPALAGCATPTTDHEPPLTVTDGSIRYGTCSGIESILPVPIEEARAKLPQGYAPVPLDPAGATAALVVAIAHCDSVVVNGAELGAGDHGFAAIQVTPPAERAGEADLQVVILWQVVGHDAERAVMHAWGHPSVIIGRTTLSAQELPDGRRTMTAALAAEGANADTTAVFPTPMTRMEPYTVRFHSLDGAPILDITLDGDDYLDGIATTTLDGAGFDGPREGIAYYRAPDDLLVEMRGASPVG